MCVGGCGGSTTNRQRGNGWGWADALESSRAALHVS